MLPIEAPLLSALGNSNASMWFAVDENASEPVCLINEADTNNTKPEVVNLRPKNGWLDVSFALKIN